MRLPPIPKGRPRRALRLDSVRQLVYFDGVCYRDGRRNSTGEFPFGDGFVERLSHSQTDKTQGHERNLLGRRAPLRTGVALWPDLRPYSTSQTGAGPYPPGSGHGVPAERFVQVVSCVRGNTAADCLLGDGYAHSFFLAEGG